MISGANALPSDVTVRDLSVRPDDRGAFFELFREEWRVGCEAVQWNASQSHANVLRGVHVHGRHVDYLVLLSGVLVLGLHDLRSQSPTRGMSSILTLRSEVPKGVTIPPGVCHGFYFPVPSLYVNAVSSYWDARDELGCRFDSPEMAIDWPNPEPLLSDRDRNAGTYQAMCEAYTAWREHVLAEVPA